LLAQAIGGAESGRSGAEHNDVGLTHGGERRVRQPAIARHHSSECRPSCG
jgi:hypothetical protein